MSEYSIGNCKTSLGGGAGAHEIEPRPELELRTKGMSTNNMSTYINVIQQQQQQWTTFVPEKDVPDRWRCRLREVLLLLLCSSLKKHSMRVNRTKTENGPPA